MATGSGDPVRLTGFSMLSDENELPCMVRAIAILLVVLVSVVLKLSVRIRRNAE